MTTLNNNNCKECTNEQFEAKLLEVAIKKARKEVKRLHNIQKIKGWKSEEGRGATIKESNLYTEFFNTYGSENLLIMKSGKSSNFGKLQNSKGNGFGNI